MPLITFTKTIWIEPSPVVYETASYESIPYVIVNQIEETPFDWNSFFMYAYVLITLVFLVKMIIELFSFFRIIKFGNRTKSGQTILIDTNQNTNPFSFFKYIVFNKQMFSEEELQHIISHENIHVKEKHSIDVLLGKVFCALFWINPIMWFYKKEMLQNLEYIADNKASLIAENHINYQKTLLKVVTNQHQLSITNQFYQSLIKKRIVMLNTNQSNQRKSWKYALILPILSAFILLFQVETVAQVKENSKNIENKATDAVAVAVGFYIDKNATDAELQSDSKELKKQGIDYKISNVKRNKNNEIIAIKITFNDNKGNKGVKDINGKNPIEPIYFSTENGKIGFANEPDLKGYIVDEILSKQFGTEIKVKRATANETENVAVAVSWDDAVKMSEIRNSERNRLYIINGKEYLQSEIPKGTTVEVDGAINELGKEEGVKKYGQKAKDGVLIFEGKSIFVNKKPNEVPKNLKINFEKGKTYIIQGHKSTYNELKDKNLFIYTESKYSITEKDNVVTINGDIVEDSEMWNDIEVVDSNQEKTQEAKYLTFDNGDQFVFYDRRLKIPGEPSLKINTFTIFIDDVKIDTDKFIKIETLNYKKYRFIKRGNILKLYSK